MAAPVGASELHLFDTFVAADSRASGEQSRAIAALAAEQDKISLRVTALLGRVSALETARTADKALLEGRIQGVDTKHTDQEQRLQVVLERVLLAIKALEDRLAAVEASVEDLRARHAHHTHVYDVCNGCDRANRPSNTSRPSQ